MAGNIKKTKKRPKLPPPHFTFSTRSDPNCRFLAETTKNFSGAFSKKIFFTVLRIKANMLKRNQAAQLFFFLPFFAIAHFLPPNPIFHSSHTYTHTKFVLLNQWMDETVFLRKKRIGKCTDRDFHEFFIKSTL